MNPASRPALVPHNPAMSYIAPPVKRLPALSLAELVTLDIPERRRLLPFLPEGGIAMLHAPRGLGKTWFAASLAVALASGTKFLKWPCGDPVGVLYVDGEMDLGELRDRFVRLSRDAQPAGLKILSHVHVYQKERRDMDFAAGEWQERMTDLLEAEPSIRIVVLDNLSCLLPNTPEDKRDDWARDVSPFLIGLRRRGVAVLLIHHSGKGGQQRGTSAREDQLDTTIRLDPVGDDNPGCGAHFLVAFSKSRGAFGADVESFEAELIAGPDGAPTWAWKPLAQSTADRLLILLQDAAEAMSSRDAADALGVSQSAVMKAKKRLVAEGLAKPGRHLEVTDAARQG